MDIPGFEQEQENVNLQLDRLQGPHRLLEHRSSVPLWPERFRGGGLRRPNDDLRATTRHSKWLKKVKIYGVLVKQDQDQNRTKVTINDFTGKTTANMKQKSYTSEHSLPILEGSWVSAFIQVRPFKDKIMSVCFSL